VRIDDSHLSQWRTNGYTVVESFLSAQELAGLQEDVALYFPPWEEFVRHRPRYPHLETRFGHVTFPYLGRRLNMLSLHEDLIDFAERALGTRDVFLTQSGTAAKYAGTADFEQDLHLDYGNNTLLVPRPDGRWHQLGCIVYLSEVTRDMGPTYIVPGIVRGEAAHWPGTRPRHGWEQLYAQEQAVEVPAGSVLLYSMSTLHRGSRMTATSGVRYSHHLSWRAAGLEWMAFHAFARSGREPGMTLVMEQASPRQRETLGVPPPGHEYWTAETIAGVASRYPGWDMEPYRGRLGEASAAAGAPGVQGSGRW
jgi:hypothetical protein